MKTTVTLKFFSNLSSGDRLDVHYREELTLARVTTTLTGAKFISYRKNCFPGTFTPTLYRGYSNRRAFWFKRQRKVA